MGTHTHTPRLKEKAQHEFIDLVDIKGLLLIYVSTKDANADTESRSRDRGKPRRRGGVTEQGLPLVCNLQLESLSLWCRSSWSHEYLHQVRFFSVTRVSVLLWMFISDVAFNSREGIKHFCFFTGWVRCKDKSIVG